MPVVDLTPDVVAEIARRVEHAATAHRIPSVIAGIVAGGRVVHTSCAGSQARPITPTSVFRIASMTKSFTAAAVLLLRDEGALALDDPIGDHVPELRELTGPTVDSPPITVRQLLTMNSGLATDDAWADRHLDDDPTAMDALFTHGATFAHPGGVTMEYSNYGYAMLGRAITNVSGQECGSFISARLLRPLGLDHTFWSVSGAAPATDIVEGYRLLDDEVVAEATAQGHGGFAAMGGLWSCVADLARWVDFLADAFPSRDDADPGPLRRASRRDMQQVHRAYGAPVLRHGADGALRQIGYGYGMGLQRMHHLELGEVVAHSGGLPGYGSNMRWLPHRGVGVVALANITYAPMGELTHELLEFLGDVGALGDPPPRTVAPALSHFAARLVALLNEWDDEEAGVIFADNVDADEPFPLRRRAAAERVAAHGPLTLERIEAQSATEADVHLRAGPVSFSLELQLAPTIPPLVQWYEIGEQPRPPDME